MNTGFVFRMARRELRASSRRLAVLAFAVAFGVAALVAVNGFSRNLRESVAAQAQALLGADLALESRRPLPGPAVALLDSLPGDRADVVSFSGMTYAPRGETARLAQVSAIGRGWPFYGTIVTEPASAWSRLHDGRHAVIDPSLLAALGAAIGDSMSLGQARFAIIGTLTSMPGDVGVRSAFGPRAFIPDRYLDATGLLGFGARAEYGAYMRLPPSVDAQRVAADWRPQMRAERVRVRTVADDRNRLDNALTRLGNFLGLVALVALLLGGLGVASAVHVHVRRRLPSVAVLRCLGATSEQVFGIYVAQAALLGLAGGVLGAALGLAVQQLLPMVLAGLIPPDIRTTPAWREALAGIGIGVWVAVVFALLPLLEVRRVPPLAALRRDVEPGTGSRDAARWLALASLAGTVLLFAVVQAGQWRVGVAFAIGIAIALVGLRAAALGLVRLARRVTRGTLPFTLRQGIANLQRPGNQTAAVVIALGFGAFLLAALHLSQHNLISALDVSSAGAARPNIAFFDIQPDQLEGVQGVLREAGVEAAPPVAIVPMRIAAIRGREVSQVRSQAEEADSAPSGWAVRREYRSTWRDTLVGSEALLSGSWWEGPRDSGTVARISIERDVAEELGVGLGDEIAWDVQGLRVPTRITSIREVDWARFEPNFFVVFEPGVIDEAPHSWVTMARVEDPLARGRLPRRIAEAWPNVTSLDLTLLQQALERLVGRVSLAIRFMAIFSLAAGLVVLAATVATSRDQRVREGALLRTLGASAAQLYRVVVAEYVSLGAIAGGAAALLAAGAGWALARWLFEVPYAVPVSALVAVVLIPAALAGLAGAWASRDVASHAPLETLRRAAD